MSGEKIIGFYWGKKQFNAVEARDGLALLTCRFSSDEGAPVALIQKVLRENRFESRRCALSIPNSESMIRSFVLPAMNPSEVSRVVEYEIKKYIPFALDQLIFTFQSFPYLEKNVKKIRIVLAAVRKDVLHHCCHNLEQAGLSVFWAEPAPISLLRVLVSKKEIRTDQKVIIVVLDQAIGQIIFVQKGVCQFVRDFSLMSSVNEVATDGLMAHKKLQNEIHMSMDFYSRQFEDDKISQILVVSAYDDAAMLGELSKEFELPAKHLTPVQLLRSQSADVSAVYAFGAAMSINSNLNLAFNFSNKQVKSDGTFLSGIDWFLFERVAKTAIFCFVVYGLAWAGVHFKVNQMNQQATALASRDLDFEEINAEEILAKSGKNNRLLKEYKGIRLSSRLALILANIPGLFVDGVWLRDLSVKYVVNNSGDASVALEIYGYVFLDKANKEIRIVNDLTVKVKNHVVLGKYFKNAVINTVERQVYQDKTVTVFTLNCS